MQIFVCRSCKASTSRSVHINGYFPQPPAAKAWTPKSTEYRARAKECRSRAGEGSDADIKAEFERLAAAWDAFAAQEEESDLLSDDYFEKHSGKG